MKKLLFVFAILGLAIIATAGFNEQRFGTTIGDQAPMMSLVNQNGTVTTADHQGKYLLLTFWKAEDAPARQAVKTYQSWIKNNSENTANLQVMSVNLGDDMALYRNLIKSDRLNPANLYHLSHIQARNADAEYNLAGGSGTFLLSPDGRILAHNPTVQQISNLIKG